VNLIATIVVTLTLTVSAYTNCDPGMRCDGVMATGLQTYNGVCACPEAFPFGTEYIVNGRKYTCLDRGYALEDGRTNLDLWFEDRQEALEFGIQDLGVTIIKIRRRERNERLPRTAYDDGGESSDGGHEHRRPRGFR